MEDIRLICGLGNPGAEYEQTRHNIGFLAVETFGRACGAQWKSESKFSAKVARGMVGGVPVALCEPQTFMNLSGEAVGKLARYFRADLARTMIVVDDADLPFGSLRMRAEGSSGGHHGLESVEQHLGSRSYPRLRLGIGRQDSAVREITGHVLGRFDKDESLLLSEVLKRASDALKCWMEFGMAVAMNRFNGAPNAPKRKKSQSE